MFVIRGGKPLAGRVRVEGAKNSALPIMAAALLADGETVLRDVPNLVDVTTLAELLRTLGMKIERRADRSLSMEVVDQRPVIADYELVRKMRASFCVLGPLLARRGRACVSLPGGCNIGDRPIELHLKGLRALGADIRVEKGYVLAEVKRLHGNRIYLGGPFGSTVTGTCNVLSAAVLAEGETIIEAAACEPEVIDLGNLLNAMGAKIEGLGTPFLRIEGVDRLTGIEHRIIPDRIEAATLMVAAAITGGCVELENVNLNHLTALPYPGLPTDVQAQFMSLLCLASGISVVTDKVFPDRFLHAAELARLGATIRREGPSAIISGVRQLSGACIMASDLRASAALVLAGLAAEGETVVKRIYHLDRGYEFLERKLNYLGADISRVEDKPENMPRSLCLLEATGEPPASFEAPHFLRTPAPKNAATPSDET